MLSLTASLLSYTDGVYHGRRNASALYEVDEIAAVPRHVPSCHAVRKCKDRALIHDKTQTIPTFTDRVLYLGSGGGYGLP